MYIDHIGLVAEDPERTIAFYRELLDGSVERRAGHTVVRAGEIQIAVSARLPSDPSPLVFARGQHVALRLLPTQRQALLRRIAAFAHEEAGGRSYVRDPDGFVVELVFE